MSLTLLLCFFFSHAASKSCIDNSMTFSNAVFQMTDLPEDHVNEVIKICLSVIYYVIFHSSLSPFSHFLPLWPLLLMRMWVWLRRKKRRICIMMCQDLSDHIMFNLDCRSDTCSIYYVYSLCSVT